MTTDYTDMEKEPFSHFPRIREIRAVRGWFAIRLHNLSRRTRTSEYGGSATADYGSAKGFPDRGK